MWLKSFKQNLPRLLEDRPDSSKRRELKWAKKQTLRNKFHLVKCSTKRLLIVGGDLHMLGTLPVMKEINHFGICFGKSKLQYYKPQEALNVHNNDISFFVMSEVKKKLQPLSKKSLSIKLDACWASFTHVFARQFSIVQQCEQCAWPTDRRSGLCLRGCAPPSRSSVQRLETS